MPDQEVSMMSAMSRRELLQGLGAGLAAAATWPVAAQSYGSISANEKIVLGVVGVRGRGSALAMGFATRPDCEVGYLADVDSTLFGIEPPPGYAERFPSNFRGPRVQGLEKAQGRAPKTVRDFRRILDDKSVDAIVIATPDHWHALATIWACQAGKDVYVEKPISHSPWEGRMMVEAARKYKRIVQVGTQSRSAPYIHAAKEYISQGKLGRIHLCRVCTMSLWPNFPMAPDSDPPQEFDWDMWNGPAPEHGYNVTFRNHWHHFWRYSGGDIINNGVHSIDIGRMLCGVEYPRAVHASGGRFNSEGAAETPDTQVVTYDFDRLVMTFELTNYTPYMIKADREIRDGDLFPYWPQNGDRIELYGEKGLMCIGPVGSGWQVFGRQKSRQPVVTAQMFGRFPDAAHQDNFAQCIRTRETPNADIREGHLSTLLSQFGNISCRLGGQKLIIDPRTESFAHCPEANQFLRREYRKPWVVPDQA